MAQNLFIKCFAIVVGTEGGFTDDPEDPGNWTSGEIGVGVLKGTKYGVSAASYPDLDIANLTIAQAQAIYQRDYWEKIGVSLEEAPFALIMFDAAVNHGVEGAVRWLQRALLLKADGDPGPITRGAADRALSADPVRLAANTLAERIREMPSFSAWDHDGAGWSARCARLPFEGMQIQAELRA
jgi:lysozyme family protein